jgi:hypothetical protein
MKYLQNHKIYQIFKYHFFKNIILKCNLHPNFIVSTLNFKPLSLNFNVKPYTQTLILIFNLKPNPNHNFKH